MTTSQSIDHDAALLWLRDRGRQGAGDGYYSATDRKPAGPRDRLEMLADAAEREGASDAVVQALRHAAQTVAAGESENRSLDPLRRRLAAVRNSQDRQAVRDALTDAAEGTDGQERRRIGLFIDRLDGAPMLAELPITRLKVLAAFPDQDVVVNLGSGTVDTSSSGVDTSSGTTTDPGPSTDTGGTLDVRTNTGFSFGSSSGIDQWVIPDGQGGSEAGSAAGSYLGAIIGEQLGGAAGAAAGASAGGSIGEGGSLADVAGLFACALCGEVSVLLCIPCAQAAESAVEWIVNKLTALFE